MNSYVGKKPSQISSAVEPAGKKVPLSVRKVPTICVHRTSVSGMVLSSRFGYTFSTSSRIVDVYYTCGHVTLGVMYRQCSTSSYVLLPKSRTQMKPSESPRNTKNTSH